ncbi:MAG: AAA domain-containing protein [Planctomycetota bacterium]
MDNNEQAKPMTLREFALQRFSSGGFSTEDLATTLLPLMRETLEAHLAETVAPLRGLSDLRVDHSRIWFPEGLRKPFQLNTQLLAQFSEKRADAFDVMDEFSAQTDLDSGDRKQDNLAIGAFDESFDRQVYLPGYTCWELEQDHHDPLTDIFCLGMLMASLICSLDFEQKDDLEQFVEHRQNLFQIAPDLHPVVASLIVRMTELDRHERLQDLPAAIETLANYREQQTDFAIELASIDGFETRDHRTKQGVVLSRLKKRLFDISRRNRLLHFRQTMQSVNLTHASIPLSFDIKALRPDRLLVWNPSLQKRVCSGKPLNLNQFLNFSEAIYLPAVLDRLLAEARRDAAEFGTAQLRLVICFLKWSNLKEKPIQQFDSPLLLLPVQLKKKKGLTDSYNLEIVESIAEVNPVIRHQFKELYEIELPESIDLEKTNVNQFYEFLNSHISRSSSGVTLERIDKPRINLIHEKAKRRLDQYRRRARLSGRGMRSFLDLDYSYDPANYHPLGIKVFANLISPSNVRLRQLIEKVPPPGKSICEDDQEPKPDSENTIEVKKTLVEFEASSNNPYVWEFDLCNVTLANFKYRKMSLVSDYNVLLDNGATSDAFDAVFSLQPANDDLDELSPTPIEDRYDVLPCDPTQASSISKARAGRSYIVQGPPGTGKSQTIANLIADYVARGKRVLFVCEKRAAIDVVYARLKQRGLGPLCCLIHDSQADKKEFVMDLKATFESFQETSSSQAPDRTRTVAELTRSLKQLDHIHQSMRAELETTGISVRKLLQKCIALHEALPDLDPLQREALPDYAQYFEHRDALQELQSIIGDFQADGVFANHPLSGVSPDVGNLERPLAIVEQNLQAAVGLLPALAQQLDDSGIPAPQRSTPLQSEMLIDLAETLMPFSKHDQLHLLDPTSSLASEYDQLTEQLQQLQQKLEQTTEETHRWKEPIPKSDLAAAIAQAKRFQGSFFAWLSPAWWRLRGIMNRSYDFRSHVIRPDWVTVLQQLSNRYDVQKKLSDHERNITKVFPVHNEFSNDLAATQKAIAEGREWMDERSDTLQRIIRALIKSKQHKRVISRLADARDAFDEFALCLDVVLEDWRQREWTALEHQLNHVLAARDQLPDFLVCLQRMRDLPDNLSYSIRHLPLKFDALEAAIADETYRSVLLHQRELNRFNFAEHQTQRTRCYDHYLKWLDANANEIVSRQQSIFLEHIDLCSRPTSELTAEEKAFRKRYQKGRRELEHEFGKSMRYKPIRDLLVGESGSVVNDLKPVWLMSPLSVSDTLPLQPSLVDVVIFDEASQVTLEEAIPTIFRAPQAIVVGDEMQLPPTSFFSSRKSSDDGELEFEEDGEVMQYSLSTNSLLNHATGNLPCTMLGWHYRSRSESLISFSNRAFYRGRLLTVPDEAVRTTKRPRIVVEDTEQGIQRSHEITDRAVSFHLMEQGIYRDRKNVVEASYIAHLVKGLLQQNEGKTDSERLSIGIVAFSEAQQSAIEQELQKLASQDAEFRSAFELESEREVDGQFVGLLVKNLENIQGDERDIVILSVCYGPNEQGRMLMNFGPINTSGGEKRLNVAFSRSKRHMCLVSSITGDAITNDYNDGARCLKEYLLYSESVSVGNSFSSQAILQRLCPLADVGESNQQQSVLTEQIADEIRSRGLIVDTNIGQSHFRCHLGVRLPEDTIYRLGILIDGAEYYQLNDSLERDVMRPNLLEAFGWQVSIVLAKDWYHDRNAVIDRLLSKIEPHPK